MSITTPGDRRSALQAPLCARSFGGDTADASASCTCHRRHTLVGRRELHCTAPRSARAGTCPSAAYRTSVRLCGPGSSCPAASEPVRRRRCSWIDPQSSSAPQCAAGRAHALERHHNGARVRVVHSLAVHVGDRVRSLLQRCKRRCARVPSAVIRPMLQACTRALVQAYDHGRLGARAAPSHPDAARTPRRPRLQCMRHDAQQTIGGDDRFGRQNRR